MSDFEYIEIPGWHWSAPFPDGAVFVGNEAAPPADASYPHGPLYRKVPVEVTVARFRTEPVRVRITEGLSTVVLVDTEAMWPVDGECITALIAAPGIKPGSMISQWIDGGVAQMTGVAEVSAEVDGLMAWTPPDERATFDQWVAEGKRLQQELGL